MLPTLTLRLMAAMINPPKPLGFDVVDGSKTVGVLTIDELRNALAQWDALEAKRK